ncbi:MAG: hypothetical protein K0Q95_2590 [Bacteroidota bacterium]|jgi:hypothetical protein|nr:hypothetical protein [Bacteroidota bacterium]
MVTKYKYLLFIICGALLLMFDAVFNGFPIVYSDTATYLSSGFELETPFDRPITYGLFLRLSSLNGISFYATIFFQAMITSFLIFELTKLFIKQKTEMYGLVITAFLSFFTGLSWTVCQLIPDIFTAITLLSLVLILFGRFSFKKNLPFFILFFISAAMHMSHLLLFSLLLLSLIIFRKKILPIGVYKYRNADLSFLFILTLVTILTMGSALSKSRHVFFMGAMVEHGILKSYLEDNCNEAPYKLCAYKDSLPRYAYQFIWEKDNSPLYKMGTWESVKPEFNAIIKATLTQPRYIGMHLTASVKASVDQLSRFRINDGNASFLKGSTLYERIEKYSPGSISSYAKSKQNTGRIQFTNTWNSIFTVVIVLCTFLLLIFLIALRKMISAEHINMILILLFAIILNAWDCGTFANAIDRLGCKMIWLIPMCVLLMLPHLKNTFGQRSALQSEDTD